MKLNPLRLNSGHPMLACGLTPARRGRTGGLLAAAVELSEHLFADAAYSRVDVELSLGGGAAGLNAAGGRIVARAEVGDCFEDIERLTRRREDMRSTLRGALSARGLEAAATPDDQDPPMAFPTGTSSLPMLVGRRAYTNVFGRPAHHFKRLDRSFRPDWATLWEIAERHPDTGLTLHLMPAKYTAEERHEIEEALACPGVSEPYRAYYSALLESDAVCHFMLCVWGEGGQELLARLQDEGLDVAALPGTVDPAMTGSTGDWRGDDPWSLYERCCGRASAPSAGRHCLSITPRELKLLANVADDDVCATQPGAARTGERPGDMLLERYRANEARLSQRIEQQSEALRRRMDELKLRVDGLGRVDPNADFDRRLRDMEQALAQRISQTDARLRDAGEKLAEREMIARRALEKLLEPRLESGVSKALTETTEQLGVETEFTQEDIRAMGYASEGELAAAVGDDTMLGALRHAVSWHNLAKQVEASNYIFYSFPTGFLYELLMQHCFRQVHDAVSPSTVSGDDKLYRYDQMNRRKLEALSTVSVAGHSLSPRDWACWLNLFRMLRLLRNRVHGEAGEVTREDEQRMFDALLKPDRASKANLILANYSNRPGKVTELYWLYEEPPREAEERRARERRRPGEIADYLMSGSLTGGELFDMSVMQFLLCCRDG